MNHTSLESRWYSADTYPPVTINSRTFIPHSVEWICTRYDYPDIPSTVTTTVWVHDHTGPVADYDLNNDPVPDWVPRPPAGWDSFPRRQVQAAA